MSESNRPTHRTHWAWTWAPFWLTICLILVVGLTTVTFVLERDWAATSVAILLLMELYGSARRNWRSVAWADEALAREEEIMASHRGRWVLVTSKDGGQIYDGQGFTVYWDAWARHYMVDGVMVDATLDHTPWTDSISLRAVIGRNEAAGYRPHNDEATRSVRARLDMDRYTYPEDTL